MCRFNSGVFNLFSRFTPLHSLLIHVPAQFFYRQKLLLNYRYYWRVEYAPFRLLYSGCSDTTPRRPGVSFHCDINFDPFLFMQDNNKIYGQFLLHFLPFQFSFPSLPFVHGSF